MIHLYSFLYGKVLRFTPPQIMATRTGFEPVSSAVTGQRNRPDYANEP